MIPKNTEVRSTPLGKVQFHLHTLSSKFPQLGSPPVTALCIHFAKIQKLKRGIKFMVMKGDLTLSGEHIEQCTDDVL